MKRPSVSRQAKITLACFLALVTGLILFTVQPWVQPLSTPAYSGNNTRAGHLLADVRFLSEQTYPRSFEQSKNLNRAADYIHSSFAKSGARVSEQTVMVEGERFRNIIARFGPEAAAQQGSDPDTKSGTKSAPLLVIGAHYDSHGNASLAAQRGVAFSPDTHTPGADDNASGVAGLLELARLFQQKPPPRPVELVAYTLEEPPHFRTRHMGSVWHAQSYPPPAIEMMIALEMIGYFTNEENSQRYPLPGMSWIYPERGNFISIVSRPQDWQQTRQLKAAMSGASSLPVYSINTLDAIPGVDFSDHRSYWAKGIPAVMVTDTAFNRNPAYHGPDDTYQRLDYQRMAQVVQGVHAYAMRQP